MPRSPRTGTPSGKLISPYHPRSAFMDFHAREQRWAALVCHRRAGKTVAAVNDLIGRALHTKLSDARYSYIAPFYSQAKAVAWDYLLRYSAPFRIKANIAELQVELFNGARVRLFGGDNPDALRGLYHDGVVMDEPAQMKPRLWPEIIRPALSDRRGWAVFIGTPNGKNEFWEITEEAKDNPAEWFFMDLRSSRSGILPQRELDDARRMMDEDEYNQEYECSFDAAIRGSFYGKTLLRAEAEGRIAAFPYQPGVRVHTAWDLGFTDDTAIWFFQVSRRVPRFFDCYSVSGHSIDDIVGTLGEFRSRYGCVYDKYYLPHDARATSLQTGKSIQQQLLAHDVRGHIIPALSVQDGIQATRKMLDVAEFDRDGCKVGLEALRQYQREYDEEKKAFRQRPLHSWASHYADAIRIGALGYDEEYGIPAAAPYVPEKYRPKPPMSEGVTLDELWKTLPTRKAAERI